MWQIHSYEVPYSIEFLFGKDCRHKIETTIFRVNSVSKKHFTIYVLFLQYLILILPGMRN